MSKVSNVGENFADKYLGHEDNIPMDVQDARYRYYQWLREWYGLGKKEATNKCPFYQFMFWGSLLMLVSLVPIIIMKILELVVLQPLSWVAPKAAERINETLSESRMVWSWLITICLFIIIFALSGLWSGTIILWAGLVIHWIFAIPIMALVLLWLGIVWVFIEAIPWVFFWLLWMFSFLLDFFVLIGAMVYNWPWIGIGIGVLWFFGSFFGFSVALYIFYKIGVWLFNSRFSAWAIKKSCIIRETQIEKRLIRKLRIKEAHQKKADIRFQWEQEHRAAVEERERLKREKKALKRESNEKWRKFFRSARQKLWAFLKIFPGWIFVGAWIILKFIGLGLFWVISGFRWILGHVRDFFIIVWSLLTETISNHCPPIDFIMDFSDTGRFNYFFLL